jgi:hypothetical protein
MNVGTIQAKLVVRAVTLLSGLALIGCSPGAAPPVPTNTASGPLPTSSASSPSSTSTRVLTEPTTTNTLPPPPPPTGPAPSTAGGLSATSLPIPTGWRTAVLPGGDEEGFHGNGTWVHAREPRYAAQDVIALGCSPVTRDDYTDPSAALEGNYQNQSGDPGIGLVLEFPDEQAATTYFELYRRQIQACTRRDLPVRTAILSGVDGLVDRRTYPDSEWTEIVERNGRQITLIILTDPGHSITKASAQRILDQIGS